MCVRVTPLPCRCMSLQVVWVVGAESSSKEPDKPPRRLLKEVRASPITQTRLFESPVLGWGRRGGEEEVGKEVGKEVEGVGCTAMVNWRLLWKHHCAPPPPPPDESVSGEERCIQIALGPRTHVRCRPRPATLPRPLVPASGCAAAALTLIDVLIDGRIDGQVDMASSTASKELDLGMAYSTLVMSSSQNMLFAGASLLFVCFEG
jgi:hypothetical protein